MLNYKRCMSIKGLPTSSTRSPVKRYAKTWAAVALQQEVRLKVSGARSGEATILCANA